MKEQYAVQAIMLQNKNIDFQKYFSLNCQQYHKETL